MPSSIFSHWAVKQDSKVMNEQQAIELAKEFVAKSDLKYDYIGDILLLPQSDYIKVKPDALGDVWSIEFVNKEYELCLPRGFRVLVDDWNGKAYTVSGL
jgi:hypothetical protein